MKKVLMLFLSALFLLPAAWAVEAQTPDGARYEVSPWAAEDVAQTWTLGLNKVNANVDYRTPVTRWLFGEDAARLVALAYGGDYDAYDDYHALQDQIGAQPRNGTVAEELGLLQGREDGDLDYDTAITRQEAAVVLARTYRAYCDEAHDDAEPLSYADTAQIASWAKEDVQLMTHLGIMNGVGENRFDPQGSYTIEQCLVTLLRLYNNTCKDKPVVENDFFDLPPRQAALAQAYRPFGFDDLFAENDKTFVIVYRWMSIAAKGPIFIEMTVVDADGTCRSYRNAIKESHQTYWGEGEEGQSDAEIDKLWLSEDGSKVYYQSTLTEDVYPYYPSGEYGPLMFAKGVYTVTLDVATGQQTYTREDLPEN